MAATTWHFKQHFIFRASTLLLLFVPVLILITMVAPSIPKRFVILQPFVWIYDGQLQVLMLITAILSLSFFILSFIKRNPQFQFLVELFFSIMILLFAPAY